MPSTYEMMRRVARILASNRGEGPYTVVAAGFGAQLDRLCAGGYLTTEERDSLRRTAEPERDTSPLAVTAHS